METKNINQPQSGVFFNDQENQATFTLEICGKEDYFETIGHLLDLLGSAEDEFCDRDNRYYVCKLIRSMLPDERQVYNIGSTPAEIAEKQQMQGVIDEQKRQIERLVSELKG